MQQVFSLADMPENFAATALDVFRFQYHHNPLYAAFCRHVHKTPETVPTEKLEPVENVAPEPPAPKPTYQVVKMSEQIEASPPQDMSKAEVKAFVEALKKTELPPPPASLKVGDKPRVVLNTSKGPITVELDAKAAPLQVRSFVYLVGKKFYDGTMFHRYADLMGDGSGYIIQGGDPLSKSAQYSNYAGMGGPGYQVPREVNTLKHDKLVIAAARSQDPDSAGSQFYITQAPVHFLDDGYTVFGKVVAGADAAMKLRRGDTIKSAVVKK